DTTTPSPTPTPSADASAAMSAAESTGAAAPSGGAGAGGSGAPNMIGDLVGGGFVVRNVAVTRGVTRVNGRLVPNTQIIHVRVPIGSFGAFKIAETESPVPRTRAYLTYNYFNNVNTFPLAGTPPTTAGTPNFDLHREQVGFEYAFLDNSASVGVRLPFFQSS